MTDNEQKPVYHKCQAKHGQRKKRTTGRIVTTSEKTLKLQKRHEALCREWLHIEQGRPCNHSQDLIRCASLSSLAAVRAFPEYPTIYSVREMGKLRLRRIRQTADKLDQDLGGIP